MVASTSGPAASMAAIADKVRRGARLTQVEQSLAVSNAAKIYAASFGPMPEDVRQPNIPLPENVKGILANFAF